MSLEKAIKHEKEKCLPYRGAKAIDHQCRNHGECYWCHGDRMHAETKRLEAAKQEEHEDLG